MHICFTFKEIFSGMCAHFRHRLEIKDECATGTHWFVNPPVKHQAEKYNHHHLDGITTVDKLW